ncbi:Isoleucine-tRNA ligase, cytoplasmic [Smittium mucronatum]|uniref:Isoleucine--tRNA ligase, cytoplasmic n=1 Tax=Smittium mucronatum TaxID=133383 RepID=A0A1R0H082_9FUNG|nr:Isoleucine-tRNA ligase, cytoplasmic [Smittium mucronatum]
MAEPQGVGHFSFPKAEEDVLAYWKEIDAFHTSLELTKGKKKFTFYDGPPFATGLPHYGHLLAGTIKDVVTRYANNTGHYVERRFGWDCHGLPVEYEIDKTLGIKYRQDVLDMGIDKYNQACRAIVMRYSHEWEVTVERLGRWIDFKNDYKTLNISFMESVWWVFKQLFDKGKVYRGIKVMPYTTGCKTPLSNFEASQSYKDVTDPAVVVAFKVIDQEDTFLLAWTTTPWTLPSNLALCVNPKIQYLKIYDEESKRNFILSENRLVSIYKDPKKAKYKVLSKFSGSELAGIRYEPLFNYFVKDYGERAFRVLVDPYVTDEDGTGVVHQAPGFGEDDYRVCLENKVVDEVSGVPCPVDEDGRYTSEVTDYEGVYVKEADKDIMKALKLRGNLVKQGTLVHSYPMCWRSDVPLIYKAIPAWFVKVREIQQKLLDANSSTRWVPNNVKEKRFGNWLSNARDWNISRSRFWGTPIPLWSNDDFTELVCVGSVAELEQLSGISPITDLHREFIDSIQIPSPSGNGMLKRIDEVFDCWFESGSMPYAQNHYPFENKESFEQGFPADFISEGIDQTRGWFYSLLVISTHLRGIAPWKNLICSGLVLAGDGKKMSKRLKNYPDPTLVLDKHGADALRLYLINSPVVRGEFLRFKEEGVREVVSRIFLPWYNASRFFLNQAELLKQEQGIDFATISHHVPMENVMDKWIMASIQSLIQFVRTEMGEYRLYTVVPSLLLTVDNLTNWYVRFNRKRLKGEDGVDSTIASLSTLFSVLLDMCRILAPFTPFITEHIYQSLKPFIHQKMLDEMGATDSRSLHFLPFPEVQEEYNDPSIVRAVTRMQSVIELGRCIREKNTLSLKTPLNELVVIHDDPQYLEDVGLLSKYVTDELNIRKLTLSSNDDAYGIVYKAEADFKKLGIRLRADMPRVKKALPDVPNSEIKAALESGELNVDGIILKSDEINIVRAFDSLKISPEFSEAKFDSASNKDALVLLDTNLSSDLIMEGLAREVINRVQRLRKKAGLVALDPVKYYYRIISDEGDSILNVLDSKKDFLYKSLKQDLIHMDSLVEECFVEEEQEINSSKFLLGFTRSKE